MTIKKVIFIIVLLVLISLAYNYIQISKFKINNIKIHTNKVNDLMKVTQITDFHSNENIEIDKLINKIEEFNPDIIVLTGDIIDKNTDDLSIVSSLLKNLNGITDNVYFVSGNHETNHRLADEFYKVLGKLNIKVMDNQIEKLKVNRDYINILGVPFYADKKDFDSLYEDINSEEFNLLLSHSPNRPINYLDENIDLILSGHTHGGQVRLPIIGSIIAPGQGMFPKYDKGLFDLGNTYLYIDSGLGNSVLPIRMLNRVQISNIEILP